MVRALHDAGLEVVLDVVFNHTAEGNELGPTLSLRGFDNQNLLPPVAPEPRALQELHRLRQHGQFRPPDRARDGARLPALLDRRDAGGRLPLRPRDRGRPRSRRLQPQRAVLRRAALRPGAGLREADRRAVGRGPGRLPARSLSVRLVRVERPLSRHHARVLARRPRARGRVRRALCRLERPVPPAWPQAHRQRQPRHLARRLHAARPGLVQRPPQRGQPRERRRRPLAQPELELRRRGPDRRPGA